MYNSIGQSSFRFVLIGSLFLLIIGFYTTIKAQSSGNNLRLQFKEIKHQVDSIHPSFIRKYTAYDNMRSIFIGFNSSIISSLGSKEIQYSSIISISIYYPVGIFFSDYSRQANKVPECYYTKEKVANVKLQMDIKGEQYTELTFIESERDLLTYNLGIYLSPYKHLYLLIGLAKIKGSFWNTYKGDFSTYLTPYLSDNIPTTSQLYALDFTRINSSDLVIGAACVFPFIQLEIGYNKLWDDIFINGGLNIPLKNIIKTKNK